MKMYKRISLFLLTAITVSIVFTGCPPEPDGGTFHTVRFDFAGGSAVAEQSVKDGGMAVKPEAPTRTGYVFDSWRLGSAAAYSFDTPVTPTSPSRQNGWRKAAMTSSTTLLRLTPRAATPWRNRP